MKQGQGPKALPLAPFHLSRCRSSQSPEGAGLSIVCAPARARSAVSDNQINVPISSNSTVVKAAQDALNGWDPTGGAIYYFNPNTATNKWIWSRPQIKTIGNHIFCK